MGDVPVSTVGYELQYSAAFKASQSENQFVAYILDGQPEPPPYFGRMKKMNKMGPPLLEALPIPLNVTMEKLVQTEGAIVDTREKQLFMNRHLPDSLSVPFDNNFTTVAGSYLNPDSDIYLIIDDQNLEPAVRNLVRVGLDNIKGFVHSDDLDQWNGRIDHIEAINFNEVNKQHDDSEVQVLDVRSAVEYSDGHVPGSINIVYTQLKAHLDTLPKDKTFLVHCGSGQRAAYASSLLAKEGFNIKWVNDYFTNWQRSDISD